MLHKNHLLWLLFALNHGAWCRTTRSHAKRLQPRGGAFSGEARYYHLGTGSQTACGGHHTDTEMVCALGFMKFTQGKQCQQSIKIYHGSKQVTCQVHDACPSCAENSLDVSPSVFKALAPLEAGVLNVQWHFI